MRKKIKGNLLKNNFLKTNYFEIIVGAFDYSTFKHTIFEDF